MSVQSSVTCIALRRPPDRLSCEQGAEQERLGASTELSTEALPPTGDASQQASNRHPPAPEQRRNSDHLPGSPGMQEAESRDAKRSSKRR